jgi:hypothetical protein
MTNQEQAFIKAYRRCVGSASDDDLQYFLANKERAQDVDYYEEKKIANEIEYWSHIEDAWLMWLEAIEHAKPTKAQILDLDMAVNLAGYFVEEHQDDDTEQWHTDNKRVTTARAILQDIKGKP